MLYGISFASKSATLDAGEAEHLKFMREEEKLARDVYLTLGTLYPEVAVSSNIAVSEQNHTDTMVKELDKYNIDDPNTDDMVGIYTGIEYGWYFTEKYSEVLVPWGTTSLLDGLYVEALKPSSAMATMRRNY